jgi:hypothetical protein
VILTSLLALTLLQPPSSSCEVSDEPAYATTTGHPVQVGGGALYVASRERRYLDTLRGPNGESVQYKRTGSLPPAADGRTILDAYEITYPGLDKPATIYLDAYHYDDALKAPKGFVCAVPIGLAPPPLDPFLGLESLVRLAIEQGASRDFAPIPLDADASAAPHGFLLDYFRVIARASRAASAASRPIDARRPPPDVVRTRMIVVAYPLRCGDTAPVAPAAVEIVAAEGAAPRRDGDVVSGDALGRLLPGLDLPAGAIAAIFLIEHPRATDSVRIGYPDGGCGPANDVSLPIRYTTARALKTPLPSLPAGQAPTNRPVRLQALIDSDGILREIEFMGGPASLQTAAIDAARTWTAQPARLNGVPIVTPVGLQVRFGPPPHEP